MSAESSQETLPPGATLLWYEIQRVLGKGGFGITYLGLDTNLDQQVAIKEYLPAGFASRQNGREIRPNSPQDQETFEWGLDRFLKEAQILARLKHPNIVRVLSFFRDANTAYMVMEYEEGMSLEAILKRRKVLPETELEKILTPLLGGLETLHEGGFIHRDIKPANIFIRTNGSPVLLDFGAARQAMAGQRGGEMTSLLSLGYSPFEQYDSSGSRQGPWSDIYAMGGVLYRAVTGHKPMDAAIRIAAKLRNEPDPMPPASKVARGRFSPGFLQAVDRALMVLETDRPQSIKAWRPMLLGMGAQEEVSRRTAAPVPQQAAPQEAAAPSPQRAVPAPPQPARKKRSTWRSFISSLNEFGTQLGPNDKAVRKTGNGAPPERTAAQEPPQAAAAAAQSEDVATPPPLATRKQGDVWVERVTGMEFLWVPGGRFLMGSPRGERGRREDEGPVHEVEVSGFWMGKYPVTWNQWKRLMGDPKGLFHPSKAEHPVERVLWDDTQAFLRKLIQMVGRSARFRLPTEAEWEFAARAGNESAYYFGDDPAMLGEHAWFAENSGGSTQPVGLRRPNAWGFHDILGNVWEWTEDWYSDVYYEMSQAVDPRGAPFGDVRVRRGGSWRSSVTSCRVAARSRVAVAANSNALGFRLVRLDPEG